MCHAASWEEPDFACFSQSMPDKHDIPWRRQRCPSGPIQNITSGVPRGTDPCCHHPALLTWSSNTNDPRVPITILLLCSRGAEMVRFPPNISPLFPREAGPRARRSSRIFSHLPEANNNCDSPRLVIKEHCVPLGGCLVALPIVWYSGERSRGPWTGLWTRKGWSTAEEQGAVLKVPACLRSWT